MPPSSKPLRLMSTSESPHTCSLCRVLKVSIVSGTCKIPTKTITCHATRARRVDTKSLASVSKSSRTFRVAAFRRRAAQKLHSFFARKKNNRNAEQRMMYPIGAQQRATKITPLSGIGGSQVAIAWQVIVLILKQWRPRAREKFGGLKPQWPAHGSTPCSPQAARITMEGACTEAECGRRDKRSKGDTGRSDGHQIIQTRWATRISLGHRHVQIAR